MRILRKVFRFAGLVILIVVASTGIFSGALMLPKTKEKFMSKEINIELVDEKKENESASIKE